MKNLNRARPKNKTVSLGTQPEKPASPPLNRERNSFALAPVDELSAAIDATEGLVHLMTQKLAVDQHNEAERAPSGVMVLASQTIGRLRAACHAAFPSRRAIKGCGQRRTGRQVVTVSSECAASTINPKEFKAVALRDCLLPTEQQGCATPALASDYWRAHVETQSSFDPNREFFIVLMLNTRLRVLGHYLVSIGTLNQVIVHPREIFRVAIMVGGTSSILLMHNHPGGDATPSGDDIKITRELIQAGRIVKIEVQDHVIIGGNQHVSLRSLGYFAR